MVGDAQLVPDRREWGDAQPVPDEAQLVPFGTSGSGAT